MTEYEVQRRTVFIFIFIFIFLGEGKLKLKEKVIGAHKNLKIFSQHLSFALWCIHSLYMTIIKHFNWNDSTWIINIPCILFVPLWSKTINNCPCLHPPWTIFSHTICIYAFLHWFHFWQPSNFQDSQMQNTNDRFPQWFCSGPRIITILGALIKNMVPTIQRYPHIKLISKLDLLLFSL